MAAFRVAFHQSGASGGWGGTHLLASRVGSKSDDGLALKTRLVPHRGYIAKLNALDRWWEDASRDDRGRKSL